MENRSIWHVVALVATLGLAALVAVVAVTKGDREEPSAGATTSASPTASPSASPTGLSGEGPYVVYAVGNEILAYDVAATKSISLGRVEGTLGVTFAGGQPGSGRLVVFTLTDGNLWTVSRRGLSHAATIPADPTEGFVGAVASADDRKVAVARLTGEPSTFVIDLRTGKATNVKRTKRGQYPEEALLPVGWGLGGTVLYEIPYCECDSGRDLGLYALDTPSANSIRISGTSSTAFFYLAVAQSGQALYYGTESPGRCSPGPREGECVGPPYYLRRLAAGEAGSDIIRRASDHPFVVDAISPGGDLILVHRPISETRGSRIELYSAEGERQPAPRGAPEDVSGDAILPGDVLILDSSNDERTVLYSLREGIATKIAEVPFGQEPVKYLGWLR